MIMIMIMIIAVVIINSAHGIPKFSVKWFIFQKKQKQVRLKLEQNLLQFQDSDLVKWG